MITYKFNTTSTGTLASQECRIVLDSTTISTFPQGAPNSSFLRVTITPGLHTIKFDNRLKTFSSGATGSVTDLNLYITKIAAV